MIRLLAPTLLLTLTLPALAEDWPGWRGPRGDGTSAESAAPLRWSATDNVAWKTPIPGKGHSSPIVCGVMFLIDSMPSTAPQSACSMMA